MFRGLGVRVYRAFTKPCRTRPRCLCELNVHSVCDVQLGQYWFNARSSRVIVFQAEAFSKRRVDNAQKIM